MKTEKRLSQKKTWRSMVTLPAIALVAFIFLVTSSCQKSDNTGLSASNQNSIDLNSSKTNNWQQVNLVSDQSGVAEHTDPNLVNAWGLAFGSSGAAWISSNEEGLSTIYDAEGNTLLAPVSIPFQGSPSNPTGCILNTTSDFIIPGTGAPAIFLFSTENGSLAGWNGGSTAPTVIDESSAHAIYKGFDIASTGGANYIYAADFHNATVDVFDASFNAVSSIKLVDPNIPQGYAPFNVRNIAGQLFVTYAKQLKPDDEDDDAGPHHGYVDIYDPSGTLLSRFVSGGALNSPWGIAKKPGAQLYLIGNFGDGKINVYDKSGTFQYSLRNNGSPIVIDGLWDIDFPSTVPQADIGRLYFTAGPDDESHGLYGYLAQQ